MVASILTPYGYQNNSCGYCHKHSGSFSYYASARSLSPKFYKSLLDRGWRRSGKILYKPDQRHSCCPHYTIRLDSHAFHASKDQRQAINRFNKYILGEEYIREAARRYPVSREEAKRRTTDFDIVERVNESEKKELRTPPEPEHALDVSLESDSFTEEKYTLFENYQRLVHKEPPRKISRHGFRNFLCDSPLPRSEVAFEGQTQKLGSYHQCYRLDGQLVAMGVLDLLPGCVSAVYFMYHDSVNRFSFGKLGALREIALAKECGYDWWYAGFYIHNCVKMRYKGDYSPQYMLDPESYAWHVLDDGLKKKLDEKKFVSLSRESLVENGVGGGGSAEKAKDPITKDENDGRGTESSDNPGLPLFKREMPGLLSKEEILDVDLGLIKVSLRGVEVHTSDLMSWEHGDIGDPSTIKGIIGDMVATVGSELAHDMVVSFDG